MSRWVEEADLLAWLPSLPSNHAAALIAHAEGLALAHVPGLAGELTPDQSAVVKGVLVSAVIRWAEVGSGAVSQESAGPFSRSYASSAVRGVLWPSELRALRNVVSDGGQKAFMINTMRGRRD